MAKAFFYAFAILKAPSVNGDSLLELDQAGLSLIQKIDRRNLVQTLEQEQPKSGLVPENEEAKDSNLVEESSHTGDASPSSEAQILMQVDRQDGPACQRCGKGETKKLMKSGVECCAKPQCQCGKGEPMKSGVECCGDKQPPFVGGSGNSGPSRPGSFKCRPSKYNCRTKEVWSSSKKAYCYRWLRKCRGSAKPQCQRCGKGEPIQKGVECCAPGKEEHTREDAKEDARLMQSPSPGGEQGGGQPAPPPR